MPSHNHLGTLSRPPTLGALGALTVLLAPGLAFAQDAAAPAETTAGVPWIWVALGVVPLALVLVSAFIKVAVVLGLLRNAFGSGDVPPALVVTAIAVLISAAVLAPVAGEVWEAVGAVDEPESVEEAAEVWALASPPVLDFLEHHTEPEDRDRFARVVGELRDGGSGAVAVPDDEIEPADTRRLDVLIPAFVARELTEAFQIGLLLLLPFVVLDLVVAALLQGAGLATAQPAVVSLPLKLLLFVTLDGWQLLLEALMLGYT